MTEVRYSATAQARSPEVAALNRAYTAGVLVERILRNHRDVDLESLRLSEDGDELTIIGVCPSPEPWEPT